jgi:RNA polymerase sigma-70 factor (ECF subfamily)
VPPHPASPHEAYEGRELARLVEEALATLDNDHRLLIVLRDVDELSYAEIAEVAGLQDGTVKSRLHRARMQIKEYIERRTK